MFADEVPSPPALPPELERAVFETAAYTRPLSIPKFMLVAWRVKIWLEPLLFQTIVVSRRREHDLLADTESLRDHPTFQPHILLPIIQSASFPFPGASVRNLLVPWISNKDAAVILSACRCVENLWINPTGGELFHLIEDLPLKQLYCNVEDIFGPQRQIDFTHRLFANITHFEVFDGFVFKSVHPELWTGIALIPHLTHLGFNDEGLVDTWLTLLTSCKSLRVLVVLEPGLRTLIAGHPDEQILAKDPRFVAMGCEFETKDWRLGAHTGIDYWSRAEDFIVRRRSGEVDALQYTIEEDESKSIG
ncbi:hypothetical protein MVEN_00276400 [Mycena venus]|uniref:Uncharacterized protein n=1 Tax=Mycena venus TaxID=2733690 RepID=A0A8H6Z271_9AGAR|nr:hypothetical protein MVEN_00276400 [Mycena venus]